MYVCLCHAVTDHEINDAIAAGLDNVDALMHELNVATQCGSCLSQVFDLLESSNTPLAPQQLATPVIYTQKNPPAHSTGRI